MVGFVKKGTPLHSLQQPSHIRSGITRRKDAFCPGTVPLTDVIVVTDLYFSLQVSAVPTVIAMRGGDVIDQFVGIKDDEALDSFVSKLVGQ